MTTNLLFAIGTLLTWVGLGLALAAVVRLFSFLSGRSDLDRYRQQKALVANSVGAAVALLAAQPMLNSVKSEGLRMPMAWPVMPWMAWLGVAAVLMVLVRVAQGSLALNQRESMDRFKAAGVWALAGVGAYWLFKRDDENKIDILAGGIALTLNNAVALAVLAIAGIGAMVVADRAVKSRGIAKAFAAQAALIAGSIVFGLPFAFLVVTSFKEDRDMSSPNGIVWIPKVQEKMPYLDPKRPLFATSYQGQAIEGEIIEERPDGTVRVDVFKPLAIRGSVFETRRAELKQVPREVDVVRVKCEGQDAKGIVVDDLDDGRKVVKILEPASLKDKTATYVASDVEPVRHVGLRWQNYSEAISFLPPETNGGLVYLRNTLMIVVMLVLGTILSSSIVAYAFSRMRFPGRDALFALVLSTMMLPAAVTLLPQFLIFRTLGWIDTLLPLWVPAFFGSAFNIFLLRQFFKQIPMELEDASKIDGCGYLRTFWSIMLPQIKPALAVIAVWTFVGAWNNFMGPLIYVNSPENMPLSYALNLFKGDRSGEPGLLMAFSTLTVIPVLALFFFAQRYFIEGVTLSGLGGR